MIVKNTCFLQGKLVKCVPHQGQYLLNVIVLNYREKLVPRWQYGQPITDHVNFRNTLKSITLTGIFYSSMLKEAIKATCKKIFFYKFYLNIFSVTSLYML